MQTWKIKSPSIYLLTLPVALYQPSNFSHFPRTTHKQYNGLAQCKNKKKMQRGGTGDVWHWRGIDVPNCGLYLGGATVRRYFLMYVNLYCFPKHTKIHFEYNIFHGIMVLFSNCFFF